MSESNKRHCAGTVQSHGVGIRYVKQMCLETGPEDSHRRCGSDMFRKTVPDTSSGDRHNRTRQVHKCSGSECRWTLMIDKSLAGNSREADCSMIALRVTSLVVRGPVTGQCLHSALVNALSLEPRDGRNRQLHARLHCTLTLCSSLALFKRSLKTFPFRQTFRPSSSCIARL